jgi:hypothetical protein
VVASKWVKVVAGAGSVISSPRTYTACTEVMEPFLVVVIHSCLKGGVRKMHAWTIQDEYIHRLTCIESVGW